MFIAHFNRIFFSDNSLKQEAINHCRLFKLHNFEIDDGVAKKRGITNEKPVEHLKKNLGRIFPKKLIFIEIGPG